MKYIAGFVGSGNMGTALSKAVSKSCDEKALAISDANTKKAEALASTIGGIATTNKDIIENAKYIFLAVKPQMLKSLFLEIAPLLAQRNDDFILVTMAAGTSIDTIAELSDGDYKIIRIMPNTPVSIGKGIILYAANDKASADTKEFCELLKFAGTLDAIPENLIDAASCMTGCSPAWIYMFIEAMSDGGVACGLPRDKAIAYACDALIGSASYVKESKKHPGLLKDEVTSPGGTTIAGVHALEKRAFRGSVIDCVKAAYDKTLKLKEKTKK